MTARTDPYRALEENAFVYSGLDRIDSSKPHDKDNVVPACWDCNRTKGVSSVDDFLSYIDRISKHRIKLGRISHIDFSDWWV